MKVTLKSKREVEYKDLTFYQKAEIKDMAFKDFLEVGNKPYFSLVMCGKAIQYGTGISDAKLNEWDDKEIYELGSIIFERLQLSETDKKK